MGLEVISSFLTIYILLYSLRHALEESLSWFVLMVTLLYVVAARVLHL